MQPSPRSESAAQLATLGAMLRSVNAGDAASYARLYEVDAAITIPGAQPLNGRAAIERHEVELLREFPGTTLAFFSAWQQGPDTVVHHGVNGKAPNGRAMGHEGLLFFTFNADGLIAAERRYLDSFTPMAQLGALGEVPARALPRLPRAMTSSAAPADPRALELARTIVGAWNARDEDGFVAAVDEQVVIDELICLEPFTGRSGTRRWVQMWAHAAPGATTTIVRSIGVGSTVLMETMLRGSLEERLGPVAASGQPFEVHRALVMQMERGRLARMKAFMNGSELAGITRR